MDNAYVPVAVLLDAKREVVPAEGLGVGRERGVEVVPGLGLALGLGLAPSLGFTLHLGSALNLGFALRSSFTLGFGNPLGLRFVPRLSNTPDIPRVRYRERRVAVAGYCQVKLFDPVQALLCHL